MEIASFQNLNDKTVVLGGDHHSRDIVERIQTHLTKEHINFELVDYGDETLDYISQTHLVASKVSIDPALYCGILGCKNGFGVTTVSNKYKNVFATRCDTPEQALDARRVNYCNVLTFGAIFIDSNEELISILQNWFNTNFEENEKNISRLERLFKIQSEC